MPCTVRQCGQKCRFFSVSGDSDVTVHQPILHNCKGAFSRLAGVVGRCLVPEDCLVFLEPISSGARRYAPPLLPRDGRALIKSVLQRFGGGISFIGREARTIASFVSSRMLLPLLFHSCLLSFCHIIVLLYAVDLPISHSLWRALGVTHTFLVHLIADFSEQGCTNTLYFHGFNHVFQRPPPYPVWR